MSFSESRNVSLGTYYRLWTILRQRGWWNQYNGCALDADTRDNAPSHSYYFVDNPRPFVFINEHAEAWPSGVKVYVNGVPQPSGAYQVDYINARIIFPSTPTGNVSADLAIFEVIVREGYPEENELNILELPVVAYQLEKDDRSWFALGTAGQTKRRHISIFTMNRNEGMRQDLTDNIATDIRWLPYVDFTPHRPLGENFALDPAFNYADQFVNRMAMFGEIRGDYLRPRPGGSDKERYRSMIAFEVERIS